MDREKNRQKIKELIEEEHEIIHVQGKLHDPYKRGVLDTFVELYDEEFCYGRDHKSIYHIIHEELGIDYMDLRKVRLAKIKAKVNLIIDDMAEKTMDDDFVESIRTQCMNHVDEIDINQKRPALWDDMQILKDTLNGLLNNLNNKVMDEKLWNEI